MKTKLITKLLLTIGFLISALLSFGVANATTLTFSGNDYGGASLFNGASNELGLQHGQSVTGSFTFNTTGFSDILSADINRAMFQNPVTEYSFLSVNGGGNIGYSYYLVDATNNNIQLYANSIYGSTSDVYELSLGVNPGVMLNDSYDISSIKMSDINSSSIWLFQRTNNLYLPNQSTVVYSGSISSIALTPVPEPESYAMMLIGIGMLGFMVRRKKNSVV